jgi:hypothetical protein
MSKITFSCVRHRTNSKLVIDVLRSSLPPSAVKYKHVGFPEDVGSSILRKVDNQLPIFIVSPQNNLFFINNALKFSDLTAFRFVRFQRH